jgi:hypothetical protein
MYGYENFPHGQVYYHVTKTANPNKLKNNSVGSSNQFAVLSSSSFDCPIIKHLRGGCFPDKCDEPRKTAREGKKKIYIYIIICMRNRVVYFHEFG